MSLIQILLVEDKIIADKENKDIQHVFAPPQAA